MKTAYTSILNQIINNSSIYTLEKDALFHFDYSESSDIQNYFEEIILPTLKEIFSDSPIIDHALKIYPRRQLFVFFDMFYREYRSNDSNLSSILVAVWAYLIYIDDIIDNDISREGGGSLALLFSESKMDDFLKLIIAKCEEFFGLHQANELQEKLDISINSMKNHSLLPINSSKEDIFYNYYERGASYISWPTQLICENINDEDLEKRMIRLQLSKHLGSQIMNDIRDIYLQKMGDFENGQLTIPLSLLFDVSDDVESEYLRKKYGSEIDSSEKNTILQIVENNNILINSQIISTNILKNVEEDLSLLPDSEGEILGSWIKKFYYRNS